MRFSTRSITNALQSGLLVLAAALALALPTATAAQTTATATEEAGVSPRRAAVTYQAPAVPGAVRDRNKIDPDFRLAPGDVVQISVFEDASLDTQALVRPDGMITMPLAGTLVAAGRTPEDLAAAIRTELRPDFIQPPTVTVSLLAMAEEEDEFLMVYVLGEVNNPGGFEVEEPIGVLQALSLAGGPGIFAARKRIQVRLKSELGVEQVFIVNYDAIEDGAAAPGFLLGDGDTVVVPERGLFE